MSIAFRFARFVRRLVPLAALSLALLCPPPAAAEEEAGTDLFYSANALYNRRLFPIAIKEFQNFLQAHPSHSKAEAARYGLALSFYQAGMYKEAEPLFAALAEKGAVGDKHQLTLLRGHCLIKVDAHADARAAFQSVINTPAASAHHASAMAGMSESFFKEQKWTDVMTWADRLAAANPPDAELRRALYQGAWARHQLQQYTNAIPILERLAGLSKDTAPSPQTSYLLGECYRETGRLREAAAQYEQAAKGLDGVAAAETYYRLGYVLYVQKKYDDAIGAFKTATEKDPKGKFGDTAQLYLGRSYLEFGRPDEARRALDKLVGTGSPAAAPATLWISRIHSRDKRHEEALKILTPAIKQFQNDPALPDLLYDYANAHIAAGRYAEAAQGLARILTIKDWPQRADVLRMHAVCLHRAKDYANSLKTAEQFLAAHQDEKLMSEVLFVKAENLYFLDRMEDAHATYQAYVASRPLDGNLDAATLRIAQIAHKQGKWTDALETALPLAAKGLEDEVFSQLFFVLGDSAFRLEKWDDAAKHLDAFTRKFAGARRKKGEAEVAEPNLDTGFVELAVSHLNHGDTAAANLAFRAVLSQCAQSPHVPFVLSELGRLYYEGKDFKNAREMLEKFVTAYDKAPQRPRVEYYLGWIALAEGNEGEAAQHFSVVVKSFPKDDLAPDAALQWGMALISLTKYDEARDAFRLIETSYPKHPKTDLAVFSHGIAYARANAWEKALPYFKRVVEDFPKSEVADRAIYELAWCEKGLSRKDDAVKRYEQLIATFPESDLIAKARTELAELTFDAKQYEEVITQLKKSLDEAKDKAVREQAMYRLGTAYFNKGDHEAAAKTFEAFLAEFTASPLRPSVHFQAGESRMNLKENAGAREHFESAVKKGNAQIRELGLLRLGETQGLTRMWKESAVTYGTLLKEFPKSKWIKRARFGLGWALERQSLFEEAIAEYRQALALPGKDETGARAQFQVGECLFALKKYDAAVQELMRVEVNYRIKDWSAKALLEVARALEAKGDRDRATAQYREVIQRFSDHDVAAVAKERLDDLRRGP